MKRQKSGLYEVRLAYRYNNGQVEGFKGISIQGPAQARQDALNQIGRKLVHVRHLYPDEEFEHSRLIESNDGLRKAEIALIQQDWATNVRY